MESKSTKYDIPACLLQSSLTKEIQIAAELALQSGRSMYRYCDEKGTAAEQSHDLQIETKGQPEDFCTKMDIENEQLIIKKLQQGSSSYARVNISHPIFLH
jgi:hypothetical protein